jgi:hypothetical protein
MKKQSYIYEEILEYLVNNNLINEFFSANSILIPKRGHIIKSFLYKHSNINYVGIWTLYFKRRKGKKPIEFIVDQIVLKKYELKFGMKIKTKDAKIQ